MKALLASAALSGLTLGLPAYAQPLEAVLRLQEKIPLETLAHDVVDPLSPRYRQFYTPDEIRELAAPSDAEYKTLLNNLHEQGFEVVGESPTHLILTVRAPVQAFERTFQIKMITFDALNHGFTGEIRIPSSLLSVASVAGLDNRRHSRPRLRVVPQDDDSNGVPVAKIRQIYGFDEIYQQGFSGKGQHIAIATYDGFNIGDVTDYYSKNGIKPGPQVDQVEFNGTPAVNNDSAVETEVDAEFSGALAPGAQIHVFASAHNDDAGEVQLFTAILDDNRAKVANYSWGDCESNIAAQHKADMDKIFMRAVAQGVNITVASGDSGSSCPQGGPTMPDWPAAHPGVVAVGGTTLSTTSSTLSETAWSGSGGGISTVWPLPAWQSGFQAPFVKRSYPDVAFNADPASGQAGWVHYSGMPFPMYVVLGGTSIAAPQWAALLTLVGEARQTFGRQPLGFLNPIIYEMARADQSQYFDDVTSGSNGAYSAGAGWDAVTGFGGPHAGALVGYLANH